MPRPLGTGVSSMRPTLAGLIVGIALTLAATAEGAGPAHPLLRLVPPGGRLAPAGGRLSRVGAPAEGRPDRGDRAHPGRDGGGGGAGRSPLAAGPPRRRADAGGGRPRRARPRVLRVAAGRRPGPAARRPGLARLRPVARAP